MHICQRCAPGWLVGGLRNVSVAALGLSVLAGCGDERRNAESVGDAGGAAGGRASVGRGGKEGGGSGGGVSAGSGGNTVTTGGERGEVAGAAGLAGGVGAGGGPGLAGAP